MVAVAANLMAAAHGLVCIGAEFGLQAQAVMAVMLAEVAEATTAAAEAAEILTEDKVAAARATLVVIQVPL